MDGDKRIRNRLFDLCNEKRLSADATTKIMDSGTNYFVIGEKGKIQALGKRWLSPEDYVMANTKHLARGNTSILGQARPMPEDEKRLSQLAGVLAAGKFAEFRKMRQKQRSFGV
jgi:hypothetical protein